MKIIIYVTIIFSLCETYSAQAKSDARINLEKEQLHEALRTYSQRSQKVSYTENAKLAEFMYSNPIDVSRYDSSKTAMAKLLSLRNSTEFVSSAFLKLDERVQSRRYDLSSVDTKMAWGDKQRFDQCQNVKRYTLGEQTQGGFASPYETVEKSFYLSCLSKPNTIVLEDKYFTIKDKLGVLPENNFNRIKDRFGVLYINNQPKCTVLQLSTTYIITARHCFFNLDGITKTGATLNKIGKMNITWEIKFPFQNKVVKDFQANLIYLPFVENDVIQFVKYDYLNIKGGIPVKNADSQKLDYMLLEIRSGVLAQTENLKIENYQKDEKIYFYGYYSPYFKFPELKDSYGFMQSNVGRCQVLKKDQNNNCIYHGCSTIKGSSGAPLLVYRDHQFKIVGIHSSANSKESSCYTQDKTVSWANVGLTVLDVNSFLK